MKIKQFYIYLIGIAAVLVTSFVLMFKKGNSIVAPDTWHKGTNDLIKKLHPKIRSEAAEFINKVEKDLGTQLKITSTLRTFEEQSKLYAQGRTDFSKGKVTNADAGQSNHNYGLAFDCFDVTNQTYHISEKAALIAEKMGFKWGGRWVNLVDKPHFEKTFGKTWRDLLALHDAGDVDSNGYVNI